MNTIGFTALLKTKATRVYADFVPEKKTLPAVSYTHIANGGDRILEGSRSGLWDTWRVMIVGSSRGDSEDLLALIKTLDNTSTAAFPNVLVLADGNITASPDDKIRTAFVDIKTYG